MNFEITLKNFLKEKGGIPTKTRISQFQKKKKKD